VVGSPAGVRLVPIRKNRRAGLFPVKRDGLMNAREREENNVHLLGVAVGAGGLKKSRHGLHEVRHHQVDLSGVCVCVCV
jgi:hypothetical protein